MPNLVLNGLEARATRGIASCPPERTHRLDTIAQIVDRDRRADRRGGEGKFPAARRIEKINGVLSFPWRSGRAVDAQFPRRQPEFWRSDCRGPVAVRRRVVGRLGRSAFGPANICLAKPMASSRRGRSVPSWLRQQPSENFTIVPMWSGALGSVGVRMIKFITQSFPVCVVRVSLWKRTQGSRAAATPALIAPSASVSTRASAYGH